MGHLETMKERGNTAIGSGRGVSLFYSGRVYSALRTVSRIFDSSDPWTRSSGTAIVSHELPLRTGPMAGRKIRNLAVGVVQGAVRRNIQAQEQRVWLSGSGTMRRSPVIPFLQRAGLLWRIWSTFTCKGFTFVPRVALKSTSELSSSRWCFVPFPYTMKQDRSRTSLTTFEMSSTRPRVPR